MRISGEKNGETSRRNNQPACRAVIVKSHVPSRLKVAGQPLAAGRRHPANPILPPDHVLDIQIIAMMLDPSPFLALPLVTGEEREDLVPLDLVATIFQILKIRLNEKVKRPGKAGVESQVKAGIGKLVKNHGAAWGPGEKVLTGGIQLVLVPAILLVAS